MNGGTPETATTLSSVPRRTLKKSSVVMGTVSEESSDGVVVDLKKIAWEEPPEGACHLSCVILPAVHIIIVEACWNFISYLPVLNSQDHSYER